MLGLGKLISWIKGSICVCAAIIVLAAVLMLIVGFKPVVCVSGSMEPVIHTGSMLFVDSEYTDYKERDIIAFESGDALVTHRIVEISDEGFITKGDANNTRDLATVKREDARGRVMMWIPKIGFAARWLTSLQGIVISITLIIMLLMAEMLTGRRSS